MRPLISISALLAAAPLSFGAITFTLNFTDAAGETWTSDREDVVTQAANEWGALFVNNYSISVDVTFTNAGTSGYLGQWQGSSSGLFLGDDVRPWFKTSHTINFNADLFSGDNYIWWDSTPLTDDDQPFAAWDALSVARHEFGHLVGFTTGFYLDDVGATNVDLWGDLVDDSNVFDPGGLGIQLESDGVHIADVGAGQDDLLLAAIVNGSRREISSLDLQMLELAYGYDLLSIPEPSSLAVLFGLGAVALSVSRRRRS